MDHTCFVEISWDEEAGVWHVSDTDFPGLVAEASSERDPVKKIRTLVPELYELDRSSPSRRSRTPRSSGSKVSGGG